MLIKLGTFYLIIMSFLFCSEVEDRRFSRRSIDFVVVDKNCREFEEVRNTFDRLIRPWYGDQVSAIEKIGEAKDRLCEVLRDEGTPKGLIVYKKELQEGRLECKTFCLFYPDRDSGKGYGGLLLEKLIENAGRRGATDIILTVNSRNEAKRFFTRSGFSVVGEDRDKYVPGQIECNLVYPMIGKRVGSMSTDRPVFDRREVKKESRTNTISSVPESSYEGRVIKCTLKREYLEQIKSGLKTYEGRVATNFFRDYLPGRTVEWYCGSEDRDKVLTTIVSRKRFSSFGDMLRTVGFNKFLPRVRSIEEAIRLYESVPGYLEKVAIHGALALEVAVVPKVSRPGIIKPGSTFSSNFVDSRGGEEKRKRSSDERTAEEGQGRQGGEEKRKRSSGERTAEEGQEKSDRKG